MYVRKYRYSLYTYTVRTYIYILYLTGKSLQWVGALGFVVLYIYAVISYIGYQSYFDDPENSGHCKTLFQCSITTIRLGLLGGSLLTVSKSKCQYITHISSIKCLFLINIVGQLYVHRMATQDLISSQDIIFCVPYLMCHFSLL